MKLPHNLYVIVLAPTLHSNNENIDYYCDYTQSIAEYTKVFAELQIQWIWQPVTIDDYENIILEKQSFAEKNNLKAVFFNLCDGDETNAVPGVSVIHFLNDIKATYTGSDDYFYDITTSKQFMKLAFDDEKVANADWTFVDNVNEIEENVFEILGTPLIVKPAVSAGSMGVGIKNVVHNLEELTTQVSKIIDGYNGWNLNIGGIVIEQFIKGREFTVFICGDFDQPKKAIVFNAIERVFHNSLQEEERFLSFDRLWEIYKDETQMPNQENFYEYALAPENLLESLKQISWNAFVACKGKGYTRVDVRLDSATNELFVLEVNAQCGISDDENYTSIGAILKHNNYSFTQLVERIVANALESKNK